jgi:hypothetical protein
MTAIFDWLNDPLVGAPTAGLVPDIVFRYMGADGLLHTIKDKRIRFSAWSTMNDPRESKQWYRLERLLSPVATPRPRCTRGSMTSFDGVPASSR